METRRRHGHMDGVLSVSSPSGHGDGSSRRRREGSRRWHEGPRGDGVKPLAARKGPSWKGFDETGGWVRTMCCIRSASRANSGFMMALNIPTSLSHASFTCTPRYVFHDALCAPRGGRVCVCTREERNSECSPERGAWVGFRVFAWVGFGVLLNGARTYGEHRVLRLGT
eukprot:1183168-Prorocentrum_minimum.AAC.3